MSKKIQTNKHSKIIETLDINGSIIPFDKEKTQNTQDAREPIKEMVKQLSGKGSIITNEITTQEDRKQTQSINSNPTIVPINSFLSQSLKTSTEIMGPEIKYPANIAAEVILVLIISYKR